MAETELIDDIRITDRHRTLHRLEGSWEGITSTWFEPDELADQTPTVGTIRPILGGRFMLHEYEGSLVGHIMRGVAILGYNTLRRRFESAWVDSVHNGNFIMFSTGEETSLPFSALGSYDAPEGPPWGWRTEITIVDDDQIVITMFNITPEGVEAKGVETVYKRKG